MDTDADKPPYSNRGVILRETAVSGSESAFSFDAYCATVEAEPAHVLDYLEQALLEADFDTNRSEGPSVRFYDHNVVIADENGHRLASVRYGGANGRPFVECKGAASPIVAAELKAQFPSHYPARIDSALDLRAPGIFEKLLGICREFEDRVQVNFIGAAPENPDRGTTLYLGGRKSPYMVRVYQKGLKHAEEMGLQGEDIPDDLRNWVRVELELKPEKRPAKVKARQLDPAALWGCSPWVADFAKLALSIDAERVKMTEKRESNHDRAMRYCAMQYGAAHLVQIERLGLDAYLEDWLHRIGYSDASKAA